MVGINKIPQVTIYVRHSNGCPDTLEGELYRRCRCWKHLRWYVGGKAYRTKAGTRNWNVAENKKRELERKFEQSDSPQIVLETAKPKTIGDAIKTFVKMKESEGVTSGIVSKMERELGRLEKYLASNGKLFPNEITLDDLIAYRSEWEELYPSPTTRQKVQERLRGFLRYCHEAGHIERIPRLSSIRGKESPTLPLNKDEYGRLLDTARRKMGWDDTVKTKRVVSIIQLMRHSGMAIRDAVTLRRSEVQHDKAKDIYRIVRKRQKTGTHLSIPIPTHIARELHQTPNDNPLFVFWNTGTGEEDSAVRNWQHDLRRVFRKAGFPHGHPHQLRDTYAVDMLIKGVLLDDVARLLGHKSSKTTEKFYAKWVPERQNRLDALVMATWKKKPANIVPANGSNAQQQSS